jgi:hypothetical protein
MKNTVLFTCVVLLQITLLISCTTHPPQPIHPTTLPVTSPQPISESYQKGYNEFVEDYKREVSYRIAAHRDRLFAYRHHHSLPVIRPKEASKVMDKLDAECTHLQSAIDHYRPENKEEWQVFHSRFDDTLRRLDAALKAFTNKYYK